MTPTSLRKKKICNMEEALTSFKKHIKNGFLHVFGAGTVNKIVSLCSSIFIVRILSQDDYGIYGYVINIVNMFMLFNGLGTLTGLLQYGSMTDNTKKRNGFFHYGMKVGILTNLTVSILIIIYALFMPQKIEGAEIYLIIASIIPFFRYVNDTIPTYLRTENENKKYGQLFTINSVFLLILMIIMAYYGGVAGTILSRYVANIITIIVGVIICTNYRKIFKDGNIEKISREEKKEFLKYSVITCFNNAVSQLLYNIDIFVIGIVIGTTSSIASYKVATVIPFGLSFISISIITYLYPIFVKNRLDREWVLKNYKKLLLFLGLINGVIACICFICAPLIISLIFGKQYTDAVLCFRILIIGYWISSTFRVSSGNVLDMLLQVKANFVISVVAGAANIIFDIIFIKLWGSIGAAIATLVQFLGTVL